MADAIKEVPLERWNVPRRPSTPDDVSITKDGRRLDTREKMLAFIAEMDGEQGRLKDDAPSRTR